MIPEVKEVQKEVFIAKLWRKTEKLSSLIFVDRLNMWKTLSTFFLIWFISLNHTHNNITQIFRKDIYKDILVLFWARRSILDITQNSKRKTPGKCSNAKMSTVQNSHFIGRQKINCVFSIHSLSIAQLLLPHLDSFSIILRLSILSMSLWWIQEFRNQQVKLRKKHLPNWFFSSCRITKG